MKNLNYLLVVLFATLLFFGCKKTEVKEPEPTPTPTTPIVPVVKEVTVEEKNMSLLNKFTGSNCGPCGAWGWTMFEELIAAGGSDACYMGTYSQNFVAQNFITVAASNMDNSFGAAFNNSGYPTFSVNGVCKLDRASNINITNEKQMCIDAIVAHKTAVVQANSGYEVTYDDAKKNMTIKSKVKFFKDLTGSYYLSAYIVEDKALGTQASQSGVVEHHDVLRGAATSSSWGTLITSATTAGSTFDYTFEVPVNAAWKTENIHIVTVIWRKASNKYTFINAYRK